MNGLLRAPATLYRRWKYRHRDWDRPDISIHDMTGGTGEWEPVAQAALAFLVQAGLQPHHTLLDAGCGPFRVGRLLINYLNAGCYSAFDGSPHLLRQGQVQVLEKECDLESKRPRIEHLLIGDAVEPLFERFQQRFDYVLFHGVFEGIPPSRIELALQSIGSVVHPRTRVYATFFLNPFGDSWTDPIRRATYARQEKTIVTNHDRAWWHHTPEFFERACAAAGTLRYIGCHHYAYPIEGVRMAEFGSRTNHS